MASSQYNVNISVNAGAAITAIDRFGQSMSRMEQHLDRTYSVLDRFQNVFVSMSSAYAIYKFIGEVRNAVNVIGDFQIEMSRLQAITAVSGEELNKFSQRARFFGRTTEHAATSVAEAMKQLGQAGYSATEIMQITPHVLDFATSSMLSMADATTHMSTILKQFGLDATGAQRVTDVLAQTAIDTLSEIKGLSLGFSYAGAIAHTYGVSLEETAAALGVLADHGLKADKSGTALRAIFIELGEAGPKVRTVLKDLGLTVADIDFRSKGLYGVLQTLQKFDADQLTKVFGKRGGPGAITLTTYADSVRKLTEANLEAEGVNRVMAEVMRDNLPTAIKILTASYNELLMRIGDAGLTKVMTDLVNLTTDTIRVLGDFEDPLNEASNAAHALAYGIESIGVALAALAAGQAVKILLNIGTALKTVSGAAGAVGLAGLLRGQYIPAFLSSIEAYAAPGAITAGGAATAFGARSLLSRSVSSAFTGYQAMPVLSGALAGASGYAGWKVGGMLQDFFDSDGKSRRNLAEYSGAAGAAIERTEKLTNAFRALTKHEDLHGTALAALNKVMSELPERMGSSREILMQYRGGVIDATEAVKKLTDAQAQQALTVSQRHAAKKRDLAIENLKESTIGNVSYVDGGFKFPFQNLLEDFGVLTKTDRGHGFAKAYDDYKSGVEEINKKYREEIIKNLDVYTKFKEEKKKVDEEILDNDALLKIADELGDVAFTAAAKSYRDFGELLKEIEDSTKASQLQGKELRFFNLGKEFEGVQKDFEKFQETTKEVFDDLVAKGDMTAGQVAKITEDMGQKFRDVADKNKEAMTAAFNREEEKKNLERYSNYYDALLGRADEYYDEYMQKSMSSTEKALWQSKERTRKEIKIEEDFREKILNDIELTEDQRADIISASTYIVNKIIADGQSRNEDIYLESHQRILDEHNSFYDRLGQMALDSSNEASMIGLSGRKLEVRKNEIERQMIDRRYWQEAESIYASEYSESNRDGISSEEVKNRIAALDKIREQELENSRANLDEINRRWDETDQKRIREANQEHADYMAEHANRLLGIVGKGRQKELADLEMWRNKEIREEENRHEELINNKEVSAAEMYNSSIQKAEKLFAIEEEYRKSINQVNIEWDEKDAEESRRASEKQQKERERQLREAEQYAKNLRSILSGVSKDIDTLSFNIFKNYYKGTDLEDLMYAEDYRNTKQQKETELAEKLLGLTPDDQKKVREQYNVFFDMLSVEFQSKLDKLRDDRDEANREEMDRKAREIQDRAEEIRKQFDPEYRGKSLLDELYELSKAGESFSPIVESSVRLKMERETEKRSRDLALEFGDFQDGAMVAFYDLSQAAETSAQDVYQYFTEAFRGVKNVFMDFLEDGEVSFSDFANSVRMSLSSILYDKTIGSVIASFGANLFGGGTLASALGFKGGRASGGAVSAGTWLVGENGPELLTMGGSGFVHNNNTLNNMLNSGNQTIVTNNYYQGGNGQYTLKSSNKRVMKRSEKQSLAEVRRSLL